MPLRRRIWLWKHGFPSSFGEIYDFDTYGPDAYLSELERYRLYRSLNGHHRYLIDDTLSQYWMLADYPDNRPTVYGLVDRGRIHGTTGIEYDGTPAPISTWLPSMVQEHGKLVLKQLRGKGSEEVLVLEYDGGFVFDNSPVSKETLCEIVTALSGYLVTEFVHQHPYADNLYPHAVNTVRMLTLWDDRTEELVLPIAIQRIGTERSRPTATCSAGGLTAEIDLETGELGKAAQYPFWEGKIPWFADHPDTGSQIEGTSVPHWTAIRSTIENIARDNTNIPAIGWGVLLSESGIPVIIEANTGPTIGTFQIHRPLLADPRVATVASRHLSSVDSPLV